MKFFRIFKHNLYIPYILFIRYFSIYRPPEGDTRFYTKYYLEFISDVLSSCLSGAGQQMDFSSSPYSPKYLTFQEKFPWLAQTSTGRL